MSTALLSNVTLVVGGQSAVVTIAESDEQVGLRLTSVQIGSADSQCRAVVKDSDGRVKKTLLINGSGTQEDTVPQVTGALTCQVECTSGSCLISLAQLVGAEDLGEGAAGIDTADIPDAGITTAKLAGGAATLPKVAFTGLKVLAAAGRNGAGAITLTGTVVGDRLVGVFGAPTAGGAMLAEIVGTDFEAAVTVVDEIQQATADNLSANTYIFILAPATA